MPALYAAGSNAGGQLGIGSVEDVAAFTRCSFSPALPDSATILQIVAGANHTLLLARDSATTFLYSSGASNAGQLLSPSVSFQQIPLSQFQSVLPDTSYQLVNIAAAWETSYLHFTSTTADCILSFGSNHFGELGIGQAVPASINIVKTAEERFKILKAGPRHVLALSADRTKVLGWGAARHGQLGTENVTSSQPCPVAVWQEGEIADISAGRDHTVIADAGGVRIVALGSNKKWQIGHSSQIASNQCHLLHSCGSLLACTWTASIAFSTNSSSFYAWGTNKHGQLAQSPTIVPFSCEPCRVDLPHGGKLRKLVAGSEHFLAILKDGDEKNRLFGWGWNEHGNMGLGHLTDVHKVTEILLNGTVSDVFAGNGTSWIVMDD